VIGNTGNIETMILEGGRRVNAAPNVNFASPSLS